MNASTQAVPVADRQGDRTPEARVDRAMSSFAREYSALTGLRMESCIHCGMCADACHFYIATENPKYTPIWKVEPFKQAYRRESSPMAPLYRWLGLKRPVTEQELEQWQELLFDSCNLCGRCSLICPMGIDVTALIEQARRAMFEAGLAPKELYEKADHQVREGTPEPTREPYRNRLEAIGREHGFEVPIDLAQAEVLVTVPRTDLDDYPEAVAALLKVLHHVGASFTFRSDALIAENYGRYAGSREWQKAISMRVLEAAEACGAKTLIVPECGHAYSALRWEAAELLGRPLSVKVRHITEFMAEKLDEGKLRLGKANGTTGVFHDPCQLVRKGGVSKAPYKLLEALQLPMKKLPNRGGFSYCCVGGGGVFDIQRATPLRHRAMETKLREIDASGAETLFTSCSDCRRNFDEAGEHFSWNKTPHSLLELVASNLRNA